MRRGRSVSPARQWRSILRCLTPRPRPPRALVRADPADRRLRPVHGEPRFDRDRDRAAGDRGLVRGEPAQAQPRDHLLSVQPRGVHPDQRLGRRPVRRAPGVSARDRGLRPGLDPVRLLHDDLAPGAGAHAAGHGRGDDGAGRAPRAAALGGEGGSGAGHGLADRAGPDRPDAGTAARGLPHDLSELALDLLDQRADRRARHRARVAVHSEPARGAAAAPRPPGLPLERRRSARAGVRLRDDRARPGAHEHRVAAAGGRRRGHRPVRAARGANAAPGDRPCSARPRRPSGRRSWAAFCSGSASARCRSSCR